MTFKMTMRNLVLLGAWTFISVSVSSMRVPVDWNEQAKNVENYERGANHRFRGVGHLHAAQPNPIGSVMFVENRQGYTLAAPPLLSNPPQANLIENALPDPKLRQALILDQSNLYILPQNNPKVLPFAAKSTGGAGINLPTTLTPRYTENIPFQKENGAYEIHQTLPLTQKQIGAIAEHHQNPTKNNFDSNSAIAGIPNVDKYKDLKRNNAREFYLRNQQKEQPKIPNPSSLIGAIPTKQSRSPLDHSVSRHIPRNYKLVVPASDTGATPSPLGLQLKEVVERVGVSTQKEPVFFVTEGYRNVLVQGPNKKKEYIRPQLEQEEESRKAPSKKKAEFDGGKYEEDDSDDEKPPRRRKVTKIYRIHEGGENANNVVGSNQNLAVSGWEKSRRYFERPQVYTGDDRRSGLRNHLKKSYRDDTLHEPQAYSDSERDDDDDKFKISEDDETEDADDNQEEEKSPEIRHSDKGNDAADQNISRMKESSDTETEEQSSQEEDDEESDEEEHKKYDEEIPQSEHAEPSPVPTKPIYPGVGLWAKPGIKHRPHVSPHKFIKLAEDEEKPDGYDVFEELNQFFENQKDKFANNFGERVRSPQDGVPDSPISHHIEAVKKPNPPNPLIVYDPFSEHANKGIQSDRTGIISSATENANQIIAGRKKNYRTGGNRQPEISDAQGFHSSNGGVIEDAEDGEVDEEAGDEENDDFVPVKLYSQVRKSENVEHEPHNPLEHGRLREIIKDSKIQTVYSEEGYEDSAYDHAGHEKKAEQDQGYSEFEQGKEERKKPENLKGGKSDNQSGQSKNVISGQALIDSVAAETVYPPKPRENLVENAVDIIVRDQKIQNTRPGNTNLLMSTQELKTTQVKDKENGDVQLEIQSEVKVVVQPNNSTKAHKFVKIYPKVLNQIIKETPEDPKNNTDYIYQNNSNLTEVDPSTTESSTVSYIESLTKNTGLTKSSSDSFERPKVVVKVLDKDGSLRKITDTSEKIEGDISRKKRDTSNFFEDVHIDTDFIDKINHTFAPPPKEPELDVQKYPYYVLPGLNENSPLRYAENMNNIPVKREGELSFYKMADKMACPEFPQSIDPIPEHVKNAKRGKRQTEESTDESGNIEEDYEEEDGEEGDDGEGSDVEPEHPPPPELRIVQLGDKIDCLKVRYFGKNPLDSPFFREETVGPVKPIFKELDRKASQMKVTRDIDSLMKPYKTFAINNKPNEIFDQVEKNNERKFESDVKDKIFNALSQSAKEFDNDGKAQVKDSVSYRNSVPFSIENEEAESIRSEAKQLKPPVGSLLAGKLKPTANPLPTLITTPKYTIQLTPKNIYDQIKLLDHLPLEEDRVSTTPIPAKNILKPNTEGRREATTEATVARVVEATNDYKDNSKERGSKKLEVGKEETEKPINVSSKAPVVLEPEALRRRRIRNRKPTYQIFDVNRFLTTTPFTLISPVSTTILPKHKVLSEVYYKDEIKPSEQLNVFADVLNNIKNSSKLEAVPIQSASNFAEPNSVTISTLDKPPKVEQNPNIRVRKFQRDSSNNENSFKKDALPPKPVIERPYRPKIPDPTDIKKQYNINVSPDHIISSTSTPKYKNVRFAQKPPNNIPSENNIPKDLNEPKLARPSIQHSTSTPKATTYGSRKILKRRRKPTTSTTRTTTNISVPKENTPSNHQPYVIDFIEDTEQVVGLVPPQNYHYKTIIADSDVENTNEVPQQTDDYQTPPPTNTFLAKPPAPVTEINDEAPPTRPMNKYYFLGLKPPTNHRPRLYSDFSNNNVQVNDNLLRKRVAHVGLSRAKRSAARPTYADVSRNRGRQDEGLEQASAKEDDSDEYVPHRPQNYYYDEKTGKIVYRNKPKEKPEEEEVEYEEIEIPETPGIYLERAEGATHPPPPEKATTRLLLATATPPPEGKGLLDFVVKLKNDPNYVYIPDPTTPKPGTITSTTGSTVTLDSKSTNPPEFLSILSKVKSDKNYKYIEDPKESQSKTKSKSTTPKPESEEEYTDEEEESEPEHIQNSPGGQKQDLASFQIFDIGDYLPKVKPVTPKTTIDYSKYKTIERPHTRHNISSKTNSEKEESSEEEEVVIRTPYSPAGQPLTQEVVVEKTRGSIEETESVDRPVVSEEKIGHDKTIEAVSTSTEKIVQLRRGTRPTTQKSIAETEESVELPTTRRNANRRRPVPSGFRNTRRPPTTSVDTKATDKVERIYPENHSTERAYSDAHDKAKRVYRRRPVRIRHTTERREEDNESIDKIVRRSLDSDVEAIRDEFDREYLGT